MRSDSFLALRNLTIGRVLQQALRFRAAIVPDKATLPHNDLQHLVAFEGKDESARPPVHKARLQTSRASLRDRAHSFMNARNELNARHNLAKVRP